MIARVSVGDQSGNGTNMRTAILVVPVAAIGLFGCSASDSAENAASSSNAVASGSAAASGQGSSGKDYVVDSSGWWVPQDPLGCLTETTQCQMAAAKTRAYKKGNIVLNVVTHGDVIQLKCKAPAPAQMFNSINTYGKYWYFTSIAGEDWWMPDIYVAKDDAGVTAMAEGVPDCPPDTPGING